MKELVVNANDRVIRVVSVTEEGAVGDSGRDEPRQTVELTVTTRIQDHVNRVQWSQACFSSSGELVISGSHHKAEHHIYIWDKFTGTLVKMLTGPHELLEDFSVHPLRPIIASISTFGMIYLWTRKPQQNWNAFAPGFEELEENIDYVEPEDEFDRNPEPKPKPTDAKGSGDSGDNEDFEIDIMTTEPMFSDSDSDDPDRDFYIPIVPEEAEPSPPAAAQGTNNYDGEPILLVAVEDVGSRTSNVATITPTVAAVSDPSDFTTGRLNGVHSPQSSPYPHHRDT
ncbi:chromatin binding protein [Spiromyces aspiralis]|uniref:Chromatin binding protein n=1 Tax=Spiromyces aspiralis TaxID=68401 RepID=A0ACC1HBT9_9FUNG|nr:chromatin binding protein [Spiromyces aspiralis]